MRGTDHSIQTRELDTRDRLIRKAWFSPDGSPNIKNGSSAELYFYDERDNLILRRSLTETGAPTRAAGGYYSILRQTFDGDRIQRKDYLDEAGHPFAINGSAGVVYAYDALGTWTMLRLDERGRPNREHPPLALAQTLRAAARATAPPQQLPTRATLEIVGKASRQGR